MPTENERIEREKKTIRRMIGIYCRGLHHTRNIPCPQCGQLLDYAMGCIDRCPFREDKPTCGKCPVHCYKPDMREQVRRVMRYAGPRMMLYHPILTFMHYLDAMARTRKKGKKR